MHRVEVTGDIRTLRFPEVCAHCGAPPAGALPLSKMFRRTHTASNRPTEYLLGFASVPFCGACIAAHEAARRPPDPAVLRQLRNRWLLASLPYLIPIVVLVWLAGKIAPRAVDAVVWRELRRRAVRDRRPNRCAFTFSNPDVAAGFAAVNADRIWDPTSPRAVRTRRANYVILALAMALALFMLLREMLGQ